MIYGYARVSTKGQAKNGNSLQEQREKLIESGADEIFEDSCTGTKIDRPEFDKLLMLIQPGDTLIVTKLDRFARTAPDAATLIRDLVSKGVKVNVLNMGIADNSPMGKLMITILLAFAEFERDMIVERTCEGKQIAREREGFTEGRPRIDLPMFDDFYDKQKKGEITVGECCKQMGISRSVWYSRIRERGIRCE